MIVVGHERDASFEGTDEQVIHRRVIDATRIGPDLGRATTVVTRTLARTPDSLTPGAERKLRPLCHAGGSGA